MMIRLHTEVGIRERWYTKYGGIHIRLQILQIFPFLAKSCQAFQLSLFNGGSKPKNKITQLTLKTNFYLAVVCSFTGNPCPQPNAIKDILQVGFPISRHRGPRKPRGRRNVEASGFAVGNRKTLRTLGPTQKGVGVPLPYFRLKGGGCFHAYNPLFRH